MRFLPDTLTNTGSRFSRSLVTISRLLLTTTAILLLGAAWGWYQFGSIKDALLYVNGSRLYVSNPTVYLDRVEPGVEQLVEFRIVNHMQRSFRVIGCTTSCSCTTLETLPVSIPASGDRVIKLRYIPKSGSVDRVSIRLFTDNPSTPEIPLRIDAEPLHSGT